MPPSQAPTGWDGRFLAKRCQRSCEGKGEGEGGEQGSRDQGMAPERPDGKGLQVENRLEGTRREGTQLEGNRPGNLKQMQQLKWKQQPQHQVGEGGGGVDGYPEPGVNETQARTWPERDPAARSRHRDRYQNDDDAPPW